MGIRDDKTKPTGFSRRTVLKLTAAGVAAPVVFAAAGAPAAARRLSVLAAPGVVAPAELERFEAETGIGMDLTLAPSDAGVLSRLRTTTGFDVVATAVSRAPGFVDDEGESLFAAAPKGMPAAVVPGGSTRDLVPFVWQIERLSLDRRHVSVPPDGLSYGDLWASARPVAVRAESALIGAGLYLDAVGEVPSDGMRDIYRSEGHARRILWAVADWVARRRAGDPDMAFVAPAEGALGCVAALGILRGTARPAEAAAFVRHMGRPGVSARNAADLGARSVFDGPQKNEAVWWWPEARPYTAPVLAEAARRMLA